MLIQCNELAWYNENMILAVWNKWLTSKGLNYFILNHRKEHVFTESLFDAESLNFSAEAGLVLVPGNELFCNHEKRSISICSSYRFQPEPDALEVYTLHLDKAIAQVIKWNELYPGKQINEHLVLFPYLISNGHWSLGCLKLSLTSNQLIQSEIVVYNSDPTIGGYQISEYARKRLEELLQRKFNVQNHHLISNPNPLHICQQHDADSCGAITAQNGKFFLAFQRPIQSQLQASYLPGARELRISHIQEVDIKSFYQAQLHNEAYTVLPYTKPVDYLQMFAWFKKSIAVLPQMEGEKYIQKASQELGRVHNIALALITRDFIQEHEDVFRTDEQYLKQLFYLEDVTWGFKDGHVDTVAVLARDFANEQLNLMHQFQQFVSKPDIKTGQKEKNIRAKYNDWWYSGEEIQKLLAHYVSKSSNVEYCDAMLDGNKDWDTKCASLRYQLEQYYLKHESAKKGNKTIQTNEHIKDKWLIPVNFSARYWALVYADYDNLDDIWNIFYFDPQSDQGKIEHEFDEFLSKQPLFSKKTFTRLAKRASDASYATWLIEVAYSFAEGKKGIPPIEYDINGVRIQHAGILKKSFCPEASSSQSQKADEQVSIESLMYDDFNTLIQINQTIEDIIDPEKGEIELIVKLNSLGGLFYQIKWCESLAGCVRNKHGYRNRQKDKSNKINTEGAKIHFETLIYLKDLATSSEYQWLLTTDIQLLKYALLELQAQIHVIFYEELKYATEEQKQRIEAIKKTRNEKAKKRELDQNFLAVVCAYYHDLRCLERLKTSMEIFQTERFQKINLKNVIERYQLGYFFVQMGETAKEISDFIKVEANAKDEDNMTRFLFGKLGRYRQNIKDFPLIVSSNNITSIALMHLMLRDVSLNLLSFVEFLYTELKGLSLTSSTESLGKLIKQYPILNLSENRKKSRRSLIESKHEKVLNKVIKALDFGTKRLEKVLKNLTEEVKKNEELIAEKESELTILQSAKTSSQSASERVTADLSGQDLHDTFFSNKQAKQVVFLIKNFPLQLLEEESFLQEEVNLIQAIFELDLPGNKKAWKPTQTKTLQERIKAYKTSVDKAIGRYLKNQEEDGESLQAKKEQYSFWASLAMKHAGNKVDDDKVFRQRQDAINAKKTSIKKTLSNSQARVKELTVVSKRVSEYVDSLPEVSEVQLFSPKVQHEKHQKFELIIFDMTRESRFMEALYLEIQKAALDSDLEKQERYVAAAKLSFAFYGQYYKQIKEEHLESLQPNLIENSILPQHCFDVMLLRHKKIAHNTFSCDELEFKSTLSQKVVPWANDFQHMVRLSLDNLSYGANEISTVVPADNRLFAEFSSFTENDKILYCRYTRLVSLNRFLRNDEAINDYQELVKLITNDTHSDLETEIHFQGSLAYRNRNDFNSCIKILKLALKSASRIQHQNIRVFKKHGVNCA